MVLGTRRVCLPLLGLNPHPIPGPFVIVDPAPKLSLGLSSSAWLDSAGVSCTPTSCPEWWFLPGRRNPSTPPSIFRGSKRLGRPRRYLLSCSLPEYFVVPSSLADQDLKIFSHSFVGRRMPVSGGLGVPVPPPGARLHPGMLRQSLFPSSGAGATPTAVPWCGWPWSRMPCNGARSTSGEQPG